MNDVTLIHGDKGIRISVPLKIKRKGSRKEIIAPDDNQSESGESRGCQESLVRALALAYHWRDLIDSGKFDSITDLASAINKDRSYTARLFRLTLLAPEIVEAIVNGREPEWVCLRKLIEPLPMLWQEQKRKFGMG